jgi:putative phosphoesterase
VRVLLVSDTHGLIDARIIALARECDVVVHAGDVGSAQVLASLSAACARVIAVRGNNDVAEKWPLRERALATSLQAQADVALPGGVLVAVHGDRFPASQRHARLRAAFPHARAIVYGHSHRLCIDDAEQPWVLNPGAAGRARTFGGPRCLLLQAAVAGWKVEPIIFAPTAMSAAVQPQHG